MKYKELPAFETNEFKVGDRIRAYGVLVDGHIDDIVTGICKITKDHLMVDTIDNVYYSSPHFKQCRKLVEVEPREWMLGLADGMYKLYEIGQEPTLTHDEVIKVREVLDD